MKAVHFGAGNIGRGFIGAVLSENDYEVCFVDVDPTLIDELNQDKSYKVAIIGEPLQLVEISPVTALNSLVDEEEVIKRIVEADLITTSVGVVNLKKIASLLARGLQQRAEAGKIIDVIANENAINATSLLKEEIRQVRSPVKMKVIEQYTGFVNSAIDRQALSIDNEGKNIPLVEGYFEWVINQSELKNQSLPQLKGATYVENLLPFIERKLYIVNAGHAVAAYTGQLFHKKIVQEALADKQLATFVRKVMEENSRYLQAEYQMDESELQSFIDKTIRRHSDPNVHDLVTRVGRSPIRKLGANERLIAPLKKLAHYDLPYNSSALAVAILLQYHDKTDSEAVALSDSIEVIGIKETLRKYSQLEDDKLLSFIENLSKKIERNKQVIFEEV